MVIQPDAPISLFYGRLSSAACAEPAAPTTPLPGRPRIPLSRYAMPVRTSHATASHPEIRAKQTTVTKSHRQTPYRATQCHMGRHGGDHRHPAMGLEPQAPFAPQAEGRSAGPAPDMDAATAIHRLNGPPAQARHALASAAASAWLPSDRDTRANVTEYALAHALIHITPDNQAAHTALIRRLAKPRS